MSLSEIEHRILSLLDGDLSVEEASKLEAILRDDPEARRAYVRLVDLHNTLQTRFAIPESTSRAGLARVDRVIARRRRRNARRSLFAAAAVLMGVAAVMAIILAPSPPPQVATFEVYPDSTYRLIYEGEGEAPEGRRLSVGSRLVLSEGAFEGVFSSGVRLVTEAPCDLRVLAKDRVAVNEGRVWFRMPSGASGFTAETEELVVVDLGTEFGVVSKAGQPDEVHVMAGVVEVTARAEGGTPRRLQAAKALRVGADGRLEEIGFSDQRFRKRIDRFSGVISRFSFTGLPAGLPKEDSFAAFAAMAPSEDEDPFSTTSLLSNHGHTGGGYESFFIRDIDGGAEGVADADDYEIFSASATPGVGMNVGNAADPVATNFISFRVTPDPGHELTFHSLSFFTGVNGANDRYSVELRAWDGDKESLLGSISHTSGPNLNEPAVFKCIDFTDFSSTRPVEFRLYGYGVSKPVDDPVSGGIRYDDIILRGSNHAASGGEAPGR